MVVLDYVSDDCLACSIIFRTHTRSMVTPVRPSEPYIDPYRVWDGEPQVSLHDLIAGAPRSLGML